jgi:hypothetical protein
MMCGAVGIRPTDVSGTVAVVVVAAVGSGEAVGVWLQEAKARTAPTVTAAFSHAFAKVSIPLSYPSVHPLSLSITLGEGISLTTR